MLAKAIVKLKNVKELQIIRSCGYIGQPIEQWIKEATGINTIEYICNFNILDNNTEQDPYKAKEINFNKIVDVWYISASTGCSCCSEENFDQGFYFDSDIPQKIIDNWNNGYYNPLASQYAKYGKYGLNKTKAEILFDGRMIIGDSVFNANQIGDCRIYW